MNADEAPVNTLVAVGHPANGRVARKGSDGEWYHLDGGTPVDLDDQRAMTTLWVPDQ